MRPGGAAAPALAFSRARNSFPIRPQIPSWWVGSRKQRWPCWLSFPVPESATPKPLYLHTRKLRTPDRPWDLPGCRLSPTHLATPQQQRHTSPCLYPSSGPSPSLAAGLLPGSPYARKGSFSNSHWTMSLQCPESFHQIWAPQTGRSADPCTPCCVASSLGTPASHIPQEMHHSSSELPPVPPRLSSSCCPSLVWHFSAQHCHLQEAFPDALRRTRASSGPPTLCMSFHHATQSCHCPFNICLLPWPGASLRNRPREGGRMGQSRWTFHTYLGHSAYRVNEGWTVRWRE